MILHYTKKKRKRKKKQQTIDPQFYGANTENWIIHRSVDVEKIEIASEDV